METTRRDFICCAEDARDFEPCPFCGGGYQEIWETGAWFGSPGERDFVVECECGGAMKSACKVYPYENAEERVVEAARRDWNRRT